MPGDRCRHMMLVRGLIAGALLAGTATSALASVEDTGPRGVLSKSGWTVLTPSPDTMFVFVSCSEGRDSNDGRSPGSPVRSIERAKELMRDNSADWLLLKKGDTWNEVIGPWRFSGRSADEPVVIASYGSSGDRPVIRCVNESGITAPYGAEISHVAIVGLKFLADRTPGSSHRGIRWLSTGEGLLIEDCHIEGFLSNITIEGVGVGFENATVRRNVIVDAWGTEGHSQGLFANEVTGLIVEENVIDHNGWHASIDGAGPSTFQQNVYIQRGVTGVEFRGNITSRAAAAGVQVRSGAEVEDNLIYANPMGLRFGYRTIEWPSEAATGFIRNNVVLGGPLSYETSEMFGIWAERARDVMVEGNVVTEAGNDSNNPIGITLGGGAENVWFRQNTVYAWNSGSNGQAVKLTVDTTGQEPGTVTLLHNRWVMPPASTVINIRTLGMIAFWENDFIGLDPQSNSFVIEGRSGNLGEWVDKPNVSRDDSEATQLVDPGRDLGDYARSLGYADEEAFLAAARQLSKSRWDDRLTGAAASAWIRAGYEPVN